MVIQWVISVTWGDCLLTIGVALFLVGAFLMFMGNFHISRLPGDIIIKRKNFTFYFPIMTGIILSILLTLVINLFFRR